jgi:hypothetical protein
MDRLSALDASFLYGETPESPMHVAGLAILDPADTDVFAAFRDHLRSRLHLVPFSERKLALAPIQPDHPVWVHDDNLDYHFRQAALPKPGTREQLESLVARLHMILLDRTRPLWQYSNRQPSGYRRLTCRLLPVNAVRRQLHHVRGHDPTPLRAEANCSYLSPAARNRQLAS